MDDGDFAGGGRPVEAVLLAGFVLAGNSLLRPLAHWIERAPIDKSASEAVYEVRVAGSEARRETIRNQMIEKLEAASRMNDVPTKRMQATARHLRATIRRMGQRLTRELRRDT
ncbi:hypothetical protein [Methylocystis sp.]|uniref:hypothetical protein n=1 Tax=Methylocystis sp. TaxID=1911079 RepID=UPI0025D626FC|nr:hypothetical protein [Methylocystis sp.]